ncbi:MAG: glycine cleavage system protein GcvH [Candidatus Coatesbacteria bacterium]|nr:glycine cleavage system protein GcvH [Candidatus Coatesbacteria bacterium]
MSEFIVRDDLLYHKKHFWVKRDSDIAIIGVTDFFQKLAGKFDYIELPEEGEFYKGDTSVGVVETGKWIGKIITPLSGRILEINSILEDKPNTVNKDPYGEGWLFKIKSENDNEFANLLNSKEIVALQEEEKKKYT